MKLTNWDNKQSHSWRWRWEHNWEKPLIQWQTELNIATSGKVENSSRILSGD